MEPPTQATQVVSWVAFPGCTMPVPGTQSPMSRQAVPSETSLNLPDAHGEHVRSFALVPTLDSPCPTGQSDRGLHLFFESSSL